MTEGYLWATTVFFALLSVLLFFTLGKGAEEELRESEVEIDSLRAELDLCEGRRHRELDCAFDDIASLRSRYSKLRERHKKSSTLVRDLLLERKQLIQALRTAMSETDQASVRLASVCTDAAAALLGRRLPHPCEGDK